MLKKIREKKSKKIVTPTKQANTTTHLNGDDDDVDYDVNEQETKISGVFWYEI